TVTDGPGVGRYPMRRTLRSYRPGAGRRRVNSPFAAVSVRTETVLRSGVATTTAPATGAMLSRSTTAPRLTCDGSALQEQEDRIAASTTRSLIRIDVRHPPSRVQTRMMPHPRLNPLNCGGIVADP